mmetsp:Transcript_18022/g.54176  ORF Transcript_18022/g.54176 Transcript_18022/m.54176 type:complete len:291 (-) Transcript_18022:119-991(-)
MGSLGIIFEVTIQCETVYRLHAVEEPLPLELVLKHLPSLIESSDHFRFWWFPHTEMALGWSANRTQMRSQPVQPSTTKQLLASAERHSLEALLYVSKKAPSMVPWINRAWQHFKFNKRREVVDWSHKVFTFDCLFKQRVNEWSIPVENTVPALKDLKFFIEHEQLNVHFPVEVRFVKGDDIFLSPCYGRDSCYIGVIMYRPYGGQVDYRRYFAGYERIMARHGGRPHWAKAFGWRRSELSEAYPKWEQFQAVLRRLDPHRRMSNSFLERVLYQPISEEPPRPDLSLVAKL